MFASVFGLFFKFLGFLLAVLACAVIPFIIMGILFFLYYRYVKKMKLPKRKHPPKEFVKKRNVIVRLLWDFPKRFVLDKFTFNPDAFPVSGFHLFAGEQGSGKSIAAVEFIMRNKRQYPACDIMSNIKLNIPNCEYEKCERWQDIVFKNNGELGQMIVLDEVQNWFNSAESKDFPVDMLQDVCQQRKQRKCIVGTSQVFTRVAKPLREQVFLLYKPITIFGCLTIVRIYKEQIDDSGQVIKEQKRGQYFFIHTDELREAYDTYERVQRLSLKGFAPRSEQINNNKDYVINNK